MHRFRKPVWKFCLDFCNCLAWMYQKPLPSETGKFLPPQFTILPMTGPLFIQSPTVSFVGWYWSKYEMTKIKKAHSCFHLSQYPLTVCRGTMQINGGCKSILQQPYDPDSEILSIGTMGMQMVRTWCYLTFSNNEVGQSAAWLMFNYKYICVQNSACNPCRHWGTVSSLVIIEEEVTTTNRPKGTRRERGSRNSERELLYR